jgi:hypothetical protein
MTKYNMVYTAWDLGLFRVDKPYKRP